MLSFFGTWCDSCLKEINDLPEMAKKHNALVYLVGVDADKGKLGASRQSIRSPFPVLWDPKAKTMGKKYDLMRGPSWWCLRLLLYHRPEISSIPPKRMTRQGKRP